MNQNQPRVTLKDINQALTNIGILTPLTTAGAERITKEGVRDSFLKALQDAPRNPGAKTWIHNTLTKLGLIQDGGHGDGGRRPAPEAQRPQSQSDSGGDNAPDSPAEDARARDRLTHHVYGTKGALCFETDMTRETDRREARPTVALDAAEASAPKQFDWGNKIRIQMTINELPMVAAVLLGFLPKCEFKNHGPDNNKGFSIERQQGQFFVRVFTKGANVAVPMYMPDAYHVTALVLRQLQALSPWMSGDAITASLRGTAAVHAQR